MKQHTPVKTSDAADIDSTVKQLSKTDRGRNAMRHVLAWLDDDGLGLDCRNQQAIVALICISFRLPGSTRDAMREAIGE